MYINKFEQDQLGLKLLNFNNLNPCKSMNINLNLFKISNIIDSLILESLLLLEFFAGTKSYISHYKKNYKEINIQVANDLNKKNIIYLLIIFKLFYLPILHRRNIFINEQEKFLSNFNYTISNINLIPFIPDIYFKWNKPINLFFHFKNTRNEDIILFLKYLGFIFINKV